METVRVRIELDGMKHSIVKAFSEHQMKVIADVESILATEVDNFDVNEIVASECRSVIRDEIRRAIHNALRGVAWDIRLDRGITVAVLEKMLADAKLNESKP